MRNRSSSFCSIDFPSIFHNWLRGWLVARRKENLLNTVVPLPPPSFLPPFTNQPTNQPPNASFLSALKAAGASLKDRRTEIRAQLADGERERERESRGAMEKERESERAREREKGGGKEGTRLRSTYTWTGVGAASDGPSVRFEPLEN